MCELNLTDDSPKFFGFVLSSLSICTRNWCKFFLFFFTFKVPFTSQNVPNLMCLIWCWRRASFITLLIIAGLCLESKTGSQLFYSSFHICQRINKFLFANVRHTYNICRYFPWISPTNVTIHDSRPHQMDNSCHCSSCLFRWSKLCWLIRISSR